MRSPSPGSTSTTWRFWSEEPPAGEAVALDVLEVSYDLDVALDNTTDSPTTVGFDAHEVGDEAAAITAFAANRNGVASPYRGAIFAMGSFQPRSQ